MLALSVESAKHLAVAIIIGFAVLTLVSAMAIKSITTRIVSIVLLVGFALGVWTQRASVQECGQRVRDKAAVGDYTATTCTFLGTNVDVPGGSAPG